MILDLFKAQVNSTPEQRAVVFNGTVLTYRELDIQSDRLAQYLQTAYEVTSEKLVAVLLDQSEWMIISILAVVKSGGAFVPVDPHNPVDRMQQILGECEPAVLLTDSSNLFNLQGFECPIFAVDIQLDGLAASEQPLVNKSDENSLMYVIYTSGTTGKPKGVAVERSSFTNYINWFIESFWISNSDSALLLSSFAFDLGYTSIWGTLLTGGCLHIISENPGQYPGKVLMYLAANRISFIKTTPSLFYVLTSIPEFETQTLSLRLVVLGGEAIRFDDINRFRKRYSDVIFDNEYGPTEGTVGMMMEVLSPDDSDNVQIIGKPAKNTEAYVLGKNGKLLPVGITGEIYIGGACLARGYLKNETLTSEKFVPHPYKPGARLYKTGDQGKWLPDGRMVYLGRTDEQVKVHGYRVELEEINKHLRAHDSVREAVTITLPDNEGMNYLVSYYLADQEIDSRLIRTFLSATLPGYMVPAHVIHIHNMPVNKNGKLDKQALPKPLDAAVARAIVPPANDMEEKLVVIWREVLGLKQISVEDDFFHVGGDSIKAIQIASRMYRQNYKLEVKDIFQRPSIRKLAASIVTLDRTVDQSLVTGRVPMTPIQKRFFESGKKHPNHYNQSVLLHIRERISVQSIQDIMKEILLHHDALRMTFVKEGNEVFQINRDAGFVFDVTEYDLSGAANAHEILTSEANILQTAIDLFSGPLIKLGLFHMADSDRLLIVIHHLVMDGVSFRILFEDLEELFRQTKAGHSLSLPLKTDAFKTWAEKLGIYSDSKRFLREKEFWKRQEQSPVEVIPYDFPASDRPVEFMRSFFELPEDQTEQLLTTVNRAFHTEVNDILMAALALGISRTFSIHHISIALEGHGREEIMPDITVNRTVGWFTSIYPVLLHVNELFDLQAVIRESKETLRQIPNKGIGYGILRYITRDDNRKDIEFNHTPQIAFNYLGQFDTDVSQSAFGVAVESKGDSISLLDRRDHAIEVSGLVSENRLRIAITFDKHQFRQQTMDRFAGAFQLSLQEIIALCLTVSEERYSPSDYSYSKLSISKVDELNSLYPVQDIYPLSPMQAGMLFHSLYDRSPVSYFEQLSYRINNELNIGIIGQSLNILIERYGILRTVFIHEEIPDPVQVVLKHGQSDLRVVDITHLKEREEKERELKAIRRNDKLMSFELSRRTPFRVILVKLSDAEYEFIWSHHHILLDGWCTGILIAEYSAIYGGLMDGSPAQLPAVKDYHESYIKWLAQQDKDAALDYWTFYLNGFEPFAGLPKTRAGIKDEISKHDHLILEIDQQRESSLKRIAAENQTTLNIIFQAIWGTLLAGYAHTNDIVFGVVVSGRPAEIAGIESIIGLFINTIPVRVTWKDTESFSELIRLMQDKAVAGDKYHYTSLAEVKSSLATTDLFDTLMLFENYPLAEKIEGVYEQQAATTAKLAVSNVSVFDHSHYDFTLVVVPGERTFMRLEYNSNVYDRTLVENVASQMRHIMDQIISNPHIRRNQLEWVPEHWKKQLLVDFNTSRPPLPARLPASIIDLFEEQVLATPHNQALLYESRQFTYAELNAKVNQLAAYLLQQHAPKAEDIIGIMVNRSEWMVITLLAVLKTGAAYLPIDPDYTEDRVLHMVRDSKIKLLLKDAASQPVNEEGLVVIQLEVAADALVRMSDTNPGIALSPANLAYVIYTSASTGKSKGVMVEHCNLVSAALSWRESYALRTFDVRLLQLASMGFDVFTGDICRGLLNGGLVVICPYKVKFDRELLCNLIVNQKITILESTPALLSPLIEYATSRHKNLSFIRLFIAGSDSFSKDDYDRMVSFLGTQTSVINSYGITETTIDSSFFVSGESNTIQNYVPIGKPLNNTFFYIVDSADKLLPIGALGELCIGGAGVSRGYLNRAEMTAARFVPNPFRTGERMYRTGDRARWLPDGNVEFAGRVDYQIKIRGNRVEPGEIESVLLGVDALQQAVVVAAGTGNDQYLAAFFTATEALTAHTLRTHLSRQLPQYMIPSYFIRLDAMPLNANGKINRHALPVVQEEGSEAEHVAPVNAVQEKLVLIWKEILNKRNVSIHDNFFDIGGHSLKAMQMIEHIYRVMNIRLEVRSIFTHPTIETLAGVIDAIQWLKAPAQQNNVTDTEEIVLL